MQDTLTGKKINFIGRRRITVGSEILPRGSSCRCYYCTVNYSDGTAETKMLKEFAPADYNLSVSATGGLRNIDSDNKRFESLFKSYLLKMKQVRSLLLDISNKENSLKRYFVIPPDGEINKKSTNTIIIYNKQKAKYCYLSLFDFDSTAAINNIGSFPINERIEALIKLSKIINKFHKKGLILADIKPDNFIYDTDGIGFCIKLFDFDSVIDLNKRNDVSDISCSLPWAPYELYKGRTEQIGPESDLYSLGAMLLYFIMFSFFQNESENKFVHLLHDKHDPLNDEYLKVMQHYDKKITVGFWNKFKEIVYTVTNNHKPCTRYDKRFGNPLDYFIAQLTTLKEIYESRGAHPQIMIDNAIQLINDPESDLFNANNFDPFLFTGIEESD